MKEKSRTTMELVSRRFQLSLVSTIVGRPVMNVHAPKPFVTESIGPTWNISVDQDKRWVAGRTDGVGPTVHAAVLSDLIAMLTRLDGVFADVVSRIFHGITSDDPLTVADQSHLRAEEKRATPSRKQYYLVEVDQLPGPNEMEPTEVRRILEENLRAVDDHDPDVNVYLLVDVSFEGRDGGDIHRDTQLIAAANVHNRQLIGATVVGKS